MKWTIDLVGYTFALRKAGSPHPVVWCQFEKIDNSQDGTDRYVFHTISEGWHGFVRPSGKVYVRHEDGHQKIDAEIVWAGVIPNALVLDPGKAVKWIEEQIAGGKT